MKAGTESSIKFKRLKRRLALPHWQVVGLLESLWSVTRQSAPRGDIGRFSDEDIAASIEWDGDESELISTLVESGFLDRCPTHRLVVHDWADHCPTYIKGNLKNKGVAFAVADLVPDSSMGLSPPTKSPHLVPDPSPPLPSQVKSSLTKSSQTKDSSCASNTVPASPQAEDLGPFHGQPFTLKDRTSWRCDDERFSSLVEAFPTLDIEHQLTLAFAWHLGNPNRRKTRRGMGRFLFNWMTTARDDKTKATGNGDGRPEYRIPMPPPVDDSPPFPPE